MSNPAWSYHIDRSELEIIYSGIIATCQVIFSPRVDQYLVVNQHLRVALKVGRPFFVFHVFFLSFCALSSFFPFAIEKMVLTSEWRAGRNTQHSNYTLFIMLD